MCPHCRAFITNSDKVCPYCDEKVGPRMIDRRNPGEILGGLIPHARFTTVMILLVNFGLYAATALFSLKSGDGGGFMGVDGMTLFRFGGKYRDAILGMGQWWRLVTAGFLHGGLFHILMNSWVLYDLGTEVEMIYGTNRMIVFYFVSTITGFLASVFWSPSLSIGASAALFGLIGAMIAVGVRHNTTLGSAIRGHYVRFAVYGLLFGLLPGLHIDNAAHIGGLAGGFACAYFAGLPRVETATREKVWRVAMYLSIAITVFCFWKMFGFLTSAQR